VTRQALPLLDKRVIEFCLSLPPNIGVRNGYHRYLLRGALDGLLPKRIQWRTDKTLFSPDYNLRYNSQLGLARALVASVGPNDPVRSIVDVDSLEKLLEPIDPATRNDMALGLIPRTIYMIRFLRQFSEFRS
jgi:asparagine synthase (glutamine-hydrolysing)